MAASSRQIKVTSKSKSGQTVPKLAATKDANREQVMNLDRLIHERTRLAIVSALAANDVLTFKDLKSLLKVSDGNLSAHARKLEDAGYLKCFKGFEGRMPRTEYTLTSAGREALQNYVAHMEALITAVKQS